jgi:hypothetical protein
VTSGSLSDFTNEFYTYKGPQMAAQKYFVEGMATTSVKG